MVYQKQTVVSPVEEQKKEKKEEYLSPIDIDQPAPITP